MMESKHRLSNTHLLALTVLAILFLSPLAQADIGIGAIVIDSQIEGKGDFETNGGITVGDVITTGPKGNVTILFDDESMLTLGPNAKAQVVKYSETPAPGISEIKIISGSFRYFPGIILENGGQQVLNNIGGSSTARSGSSEPNVDLDTTNPIDDENLSALNEQLTDINSQLNVADLVNSTSISTANTSGGNTSGQGGGGDAR